jgi:hypothetical protein
VADYYRRYFGTWENFRVEIEEVRQLPDGRVFVAARDSGRGKQSGVEKFWKRAGNSAWQ